MVATAFKSIVILLVLEHEDMMMMANFEVV